MKKIGFIDYYLNEWHANNYPTWIDEATGGEMKVCYGYGKIAHPVNGMTSEEWCRNMGVEYCATVEELVEKSDYLIVLSPDNPEMHWELCQEALKSGKPTYIDKTFAPDQKTAEAIFALAEEYGTPMWSSSALRFSDEIMDIKQGSVDGIVSVGTGVMDNYLIHQIEPIVTLMGPEAEKVMFVGTEATLPIVIRFKGGEVATATQMPGAPFALYLNFKDGTTRAIPETSGYFPTLLRSITEFFASEGKKIGAPKAETIAVIAIIETAIKAKETPGVWVDVP